MDAQLFWQNILIVLIGLLQSMVNLVIWEKHQKVDNAGETKQ